MRTGLQLDEEVAKRLADKNPTIKEAIIANRVDEQLNNRKALAVERLRRIEGLQKRLADMPQDALFDSDGKPLLLGFNAKQNAERQKIKEDIEKLEADLVNALGDKADWTALEKA